MMMVDMLEEQIITEENTMINDEKFETRLSVSHIVQQEVLFDSQSYIGRTVHIEYGERSGVARVPFHIKTVVINGDTRL